MPSFSHHSGGSEQDYIFQITYRNAQLGEKVRLGPTFSAPPNPIWPITYKSNSPRISELLTKTEKSNYLCLLSITSAVFSYRNFLMHPTNRTHVISRICTTNRELCRKQQNLGIN